MKKVLITGIGGAIGLHMLGCIMHETDWQVAGIDSFRHKGYTDRVSMAFEEHPTWRERTTILTHDLAAPLTDRQADSIGKVDYIINLASLSDVQSSIDDPAPFIRNNSELMVNILEYGRKAKPEVFLHFSTDEVYGAATINGGHPEWDTILPSNPYSNDCVEAAAPGIAVVTDSTLPVNNS